MFKLMRNIRLALILCGLVLANNAAAGMEDPLRPPEYAPVATANGMKHASAPAWHVNEILYSGTRRVAIINDVAVVVGDRIDGAKVLNIEPTHVTLMHKNKTITARLKTLTTKTKSAVTLN